MKQGHIHDWLDACTRAARLPVSPSSTHHHGFRTVARSQSAPPSHQQDQSLFCKMSDTIDVETGNPRRKTTPVRPSRKQPGRAASSRSQPQSTGRGCAPGVDALNQSRMPVFAPPMSDVQLEALSGIAANLDISISAPARSDTVSSTQLTSVSRHYRKDEKSKKAKDSDADDLSMGKRTRSRSPVKKIVDLSAARPPIRYNPGEVPQEVGIILKSFKKVLKGRRLMPACLKVSWDDIKALDPNQFYDTEDEFDQRSSLSTAEDQKILRRLTKIRDNARNCSRESKPEPSWGVEVFKPLLDFAVKLENIDTEQKVQAEDITTIPVSSRCLPGGIYDSSLQAKRVDFGIYLSQDHDQRQLLRTRLEARNKAPEDLCVNQAPVYAEYIRWLPQLLAVETKTGEPSGVSAEAQLAIWMAGLRNRLDGFLKVEDDSTPQPRLKPMPCLKIQGFEWKMYWCSVSEKGETILHGPQGLGTTQTILGTYRILAGLREIIRYGRDEYAPWAMKECFW